MHPVNSCQPSHVEPLVALYGGTLSNSDQKLLSIFTLFEHTRKTSTASLLSHWSPSDGVACDTSLQALQNLDPTTTWRTCIQYPQWLSYAVNGDAENEPQLYDPRFVTFMFAHMIANNRDIPAAGLVQLLRTNVASLLVRSLSSHRGDARRIAMMQVAALYYMMLVCGS